MESISREDLAFEEYTYTYQNQGLFLHDNTLVIERGPLSGEADVAASLNGLGSLNVFPTEIMSQIALQLDVDSLIRFRGVNRNAMRLVDSIPDFQHIQTTPRLLSAVLTIGATHFPASALARCLASQQCAHPNCPHLGDYIHLLSCRRLCYSCFITQPEYMPCDADSARTQRGLHRFSPDSELEQFPQVAVPAGRYGLLGPGDPEDYDQSVLDRPNPIFERPGPVRLYDRSALLASREGPDLYNPLQWRLRWKEPDGFWPEPERFMVAVRAPFRDETDPTSQDGFFCRGCRTEVLCGFNVHRRFTRQGMKAHIERYGPVILRSDGTYEHYKPEAPQDSDWWEMQEKYDREFDCELRPRALSYRYPQ